MKCVKKVGIVTLYGEHNLGNKLQNYAVRCICKELGFESETIFSGRSGISIGWKGRLSAFIGFPRSVAEEKRNILKRCRKIKQFSDKYLNAIHYNSYKEAEKNCDEYYAIIAGSDQVWHNWSMTSEELDYYFLKFVPPQKRICISPSFGFETFPKKFINDYIDGLNGFNYLSCREERGCEMIKELTGKDALLLCDPTMLLSADRWNEIIVAPEYKLPRNYILAYFLGGMSEDDKKYINNLSQATGLTIVDIYNHKLQDYFCTAPDEFLYLIKNSDYFCTNSFHGCVFSIIFKRNFTVFNRHDEKKMFSRIDTLLRKFGLENAFINNSDHDKELDFSRVDTILEAEHKKGMEYLKKAFEDIEKGA